MANIRLKKNGLGEVTCILKLEVIYFKDEQDKRNIYYAYCPSLDLITCDDSKKKAEIAFKEMISLYFQSCMENDTLEQDLKEHGWSISKTKIAPPQMRTIMARDEMKRLYKEGIDYNVKHLTAELV